MNILDRIKRADLWGVPALRYLTYFVIVVLLGSVGVKYAFKISIFKSLRAAFGLFYVMFLPGFVFVQLFFNPKRHDDDEDGIDEIEQIGLSFGLSMALVILTIIFTNLVLKIPIRAKTNLVVIFGLIAAMVITKLVIEKVQEILKRD